LDLFRECRVELGICADDHVAKVKLVYNFLNDGENGEESVVFRTSTLAIENDGSKCRESADKLSVIMECGEMVTSTSR
jgi:hypothetical protein